MLIGATRATASIRPARPAFAAACGASSSARAGTARPRVLSPAELGPQDVVDEEVGDAVRVLVVARHLQDRWQHQCPTAPGVRIAGAAAATASRAATGAGFRLPRPLRRRCVAGLGVILLHAVRDKSQIVSPRTPPISPRPAGGAQGDPRSRPAPLPRRVFHGRVPGPRPAPGSESAGRARSGAVPIRELSSKIPRAAPRPEPGGSRAGSARGRWAVTTVPQGRRAPPGSALRSACGRLRLRRCRRGRPGPELRACRQRAPRRLRPPGPAPAAAASRPPSPARPGRPSRVRGAGGQHARRCQHAHGGPRARAALGRRPAAGPGAPPACGRAPAEPRRAPRPEPHGWEVQAGPGRAGLAARAPSPSARPRGQDLRAGSEISRPLSAT